MLGFSLIAFLYDPSFNFDNWQDNFFKRALAYERPDFIEGDPLDTFPLKIYGIRLRHLLYKKLFVTLQFCHTFRRITP